MDMKHSAAEKAALEAQAQAYLAQLSNNELTLLVDTLQGMLAPDYRPEFPKHGICSNLGRTLSRHRMGRPDGYTAVQRLSPSWLHTNGDPVNPVPLGDMEHVVCWQAYRWQGRQRKLRVSLMSHMRDRYLAELERRQGPKPDLRNHYQAERFTEGPGSRLPRSHDFQEGDAVRISAPVYNARVPVGTRGKVVRVAGDYIDVLPDAPCLASTLRSGCWVCVPHHLTLIPPNKWHKQGAHRITSYRSFRRYKAAGAQFQAMDPATRPGRIISTDLALARAKAGLLLWAVVE